MEVNTGIYDYDAFGVSISGSDGMFGLSGGSSGAINDIDDSILESIPFMFDLAESGVAGGDAVVVKSGEDSSSNGVLPDIGNSVVETVSSSAGVNDEVSSALVVPDETSVVAGSLLLLSGIAADKLESGGEGDPVSVHGKCDGDIDFDGFDGTESYKNALKKLEFERSGEVGISSNGSDGKSFTKIKNNVIDKDCNNNNIKSGDGGVSGSDFLDLEARCGGFVDRGDDRSIDDVAEDAEERMADILDEGDDGNVTKESYDRDSFVVSDSEVVGGTVNDLIGEIGGTKRVRIKEEPKSDEDDLNADVDLPIAVEIIDGDDSVGKKKNKRRKSSRAAK